MANRKKKVKRMKASVVSKSALLDLSNREVKNDKTAKLRHEQLNKVISEDLSSLN